MRAHFPAMYALETHNWKDALALQLPAGHLRYVAAARDAAQQYDVMVDAVRKSSRPYKADYMNTNHDEAHAWLAFAEGKNDEALSLLHSVAEKQDAEGKGEVELPPRNARRHAPGNEPTARSPCRVREILEDRPQPFQWSLRSRSLRRTTPTIADCRRLLRTTL